MAATLENYLEGLVRATGCRFKSCFPHYQKLLQTKDLRRRVASPFLLVPQTDSAISLTSPSTSSLDFLHHPVAEPMVEQLALR